MGLFTCGEKKWAGEMLQKCIHKYAWVAEKHKHGIPYTTDENGNYDNRADDSVVWTQDDGLNWWTNGFWGGILWHLYAATKDRRFMDAARISEALLDQCFVEFLGLHHDVGFMWLPTAVASCRFTGDETSRRRALHAASLLAGRFNLAGRYIRAWNVSAGGDTTGWAIIDSLMNVPLLYWASEETKDPRFAQIAMAHTDTVMRHFIRQDGSSHHIVEFDPASGKMLKTYGGQGYAENSAWTRGQAWALYGFVVGYACTENAPYLETAKRVARFFVSHIPESGLVPVDFHQPAVPPLEDSAAAAIAACGLLELASLCPEPEGEAHKAAALALLRALVARRCNFGKSADAVLSHCTGAYHSPESHHVSMVYADYFLIEALQKIVGRCGHFYW